MTAPAGPAARALDAAQASSQSCDFCTQPIVWAATRESRMPVDARPDDAGNVLLDVGPGGGLVATILGRPADRVKFRAQGWALYLPHKLTCPRAAEWTRGLRVKPKRPARPPTQPGLGE